jgi:hypothetical protein
VTRRLVHAHFVDFARERLGERGPAMVRDACRGGVHATALKRAMRCDLREYVTEEDQRVLSFVMPCAAGMWIGAELQLDTRLPETVQQALPGRRLGDVVTGCGAEDRLIDAAGDRQEGTRLFMERVLVDPRRVPISTKQRLALPFRRFRNVFVLEWQDAAEPWRDVESTSSALLSLAAQMMLIMSCLVGMLLSGPLLAGIGAIGVAMSIPMIITFAWLVSAMMLGFVRNVVVLARWCG